MIAQIYNQEFNQIYNKTNLMKKLLTAVDAFGSPISLNIDGKSQYKSAFGGTMTLTMMGLLMFACLVYEFCSQKNKIDDYVNRREVFYSTTQFFSTMPPEIVLDQDNFFFAVGIDQADNLPFNKRPYFNIDIYQHRVNNILDERQNETIKLVPCTMDRILKFKLADPKKLRFYFNRLNLSDFLCPQENFTLEMRGQSLSDFYDYISINVVQCSNTTGSSDIICASQEQTRDFINKQNDLSFKFYSTNIIINPQDSESEAELYMSEDLVFSIQPGLTIFDIGVTFSKCSITTDQSLFINTQNVSEVLFYRPESSVTSLQTLNGNLIKTEPYYSDKINQVPYLQMVLRSNNFQVSIQKSYLKFDALLSYVGGLAQSLYLVLKLFVFWYNNKYFKLYIANKLYEFKELMEQSDRSRYISNNDKFNQVNRLVMKLESKQKNLSETQIDNKEVENIMKKSQQKIKKKIMQITKEEELKSLGFQDREQFFIWYLESFTVRHKPIRMDFTYLIYELFCGKIFKSTMNKSVERGLQKVDQDLNIRHILHQLVFTDRLKQLILSDDQYELFKFVQKPQISYLTKEHRVKKIKHKHRSQIKTLKSSLDEESFKILLDSFETIVTTISTDETTNSINQKLISFLGEELKTILKASLILQNNDKSPTHEHAKPEQKVNDQPVLESLIRTPPKTKRFQIDVQKFLEFTSPRPIPDADIPEVEAEC